MGLETIQKLRMAGHSHYEETEPKGRHKATVNVAGWSILCVDVGAPAQNPDAPRS